jgi:hypothetical protein
LAGVTVSHRIANFAEGHLTEPARQRQYRVAILIFHWRQFAIIGK